MKSLSIALVILSFSISPFFVNESLASESQKTRIVFSKNYPHSINLVQTNTGFNFESCYEEHCTLLSNRWVSQDKADIFMEAFSAEAKNLREGSRGNPGFNEYVLNAGNLIAAYGLSVTGGILAYQNSSSFRALFRLGNNPARMSSRLLGALGLVSIAFSVVAEYNVIKEARRIQSMPIEELAKGTALSIEGSMPNQVEVDAQGAISLISELISRTLQKTHAIPGPSEA